MKLICNFKIIVISLLLAVGAGACDKQGPAETAGENFDQAVEEAGDKIDEAADDVSESVNDKTK